MPGRVHPEIVNDGGVSGFSDVFCDDGKVRSGVGSPFGEIGFSGELMGDSIVRSHLIGVIECCFG